MGRVVLAESGGQVWIVEGDEHVSELLVNELPDDVAVEFVTCDTPAAVFAMWRERSPGAAAGASPWVLNPAIVARIRRTLAPARRGVQFTPWSAMLDEAAQAELAAAAAWLDANPGGRLLLRQFAPAAPVPGQADLQRLRAQLVLAALLRAGAVMAAVADEMAAATAEADAERLDIITQAPGSWAVL